MPNILFPHSSGFTQIDNDIFYIQSVVSASAFSLLIRLYRATQGYGVAVKAISGGFLQKSTNLSKNTITKATNELEDLGVILVKRRARMASYYQVSVKGVAKVCNSVKDSIKRDSLNTEEILNLEPQTLQEDSAPVAPTLVVVEVTEVITVEEDAEDIATPDRGFEIFWSMYDKKVNKVASLKAWGKLRPTDHMAIMQHVEVYVESTPEKQFRKDPVNYLKDRVWEDEVVQRAPISEAPKNKPQQPPVFSASVVEVRDVVKQGSDADAKITAFLKSFGKKGVTYK